MTSLVSPRVAYNLAKKGYYTTDVKTNNGIINRFIRLDV